MACIEAKLDRARNLVDVLPARSGGANEFFGDLALIERDGRAYADHGASVAWIALR